MSVRMFDTYTTSNAEAEHSALKCASVGVSANDTMTALAQKTNCQATRRTNQRVLHQTKDLQSTDTKSKCALSKVIVKQCFNAISQNLDLAKLCISKQTSNTSWTVFYRRPTGISSKLHLHYLPLVRRVRYVTLQSGMTKFIHRLSHYITSNMHDFSSMYLFFVQDLLMCSCRKYERYGYPCHHMFHVMKVYKTEEVKKEWIHIRWFKHYTSHYQHPECTNRQNDLYDKLIVMHPKGPRFYAQQYDTYPQYEQFDGKPVTEDMFPSSNFYFLCRKTNTCWIRQNHTADPAIKQLIQSTTADLVSVDVDLSQEQEHIHSQTHLEDENTFDTDQNNDNIDDLCAYSKDHPIYTDKMAMFRRASDLCGNDVEKHKELYEMLHEFVSCNEMNNDDNNIILAKRKAENDGSTTLISSNKVINTTHRSTKRKKAFHE